jgi:DNA-binding XRE family transcriptional regulator
MEIKGKQVTAARALLGWTQQVLADHAAVSLTSVRRFENEIGDSSTEIKKSIFETLKKAGIQFLDDGVRFRNSNIEVFEGPTCYLRVLDDIFYTLKDSKGEALFWCVDDRLSNAETVRKECFLRQAGIRMRSLIEEGNTFIRYPLEEYRYIPKPYFENNGLINYGNKLVLVVNDIHTKKAILLENDLLSRTLKNIFDLLWMFLKKPKLTTAGDTYD